MGTSWKLRQWPPTGAAEWKAMPKLPGAGGLQFAADGAGTGVAGEHGW